MLADGIHESMESTTKVSHVRVVARIRPMSLEEQMQGCTTCVTVIPGENDPSIKQSPIKKKGPFAFLTPSKRNTKERAPLSITSITMTPVTKNTSQRSRRFHMSPGKHSYSVIKEILPVVYGSSTSLLTTAPSKSSTQKQFDYDAVLDEDATQQEAYERSVGDAISRNIFQGYNTTILAYGQTGSGKTYTMTGGSEEPEQRGILPRAVQDLFHAKDNQDGDVAITLTYMEIHNDEIRDLLSEENAESNSPLKLRDHGDDGIVVNGLRSVSVKNEREVQELLELAGRNRMAASTKMNQHSSRSHAICTFTVTIASTQNTMEVISAKLVLVDLAGSERIKQTGVVGLAKQESININKDLFVLAKVVSALSDQSKSKKKVHVPYRDSKLTRLLRESLGGSCYTVMVACVSPSNALLDESINTLRYAERTRAVCNSLKANIIKANNPPEFIAIQEENKILKTQLLELKAKLHLIEGIHKHDAIYWKNEYDKLAIVARDAGVDLKDALRINEQRSAIFHNVPSLVDLDEDVHLSLDLSFNHSILGDEDDGSVVKALDQKLNQVQKLDFEIEGHQVQLSDRTAVGNDASKNLACRYIAAVNHSYEIELPVWNSNASREPKLSSQQVELEQLRVDKEMLKRRNSDLEKSVSSKQQQIHALQDQLSHEKAIYYENVEAGKANMAKIMEECDLQKIQCAINIDEVKRLQQILMNSASREELKQARHDLEKANTKIMNMREELQQINRQSLQSANRALEETKIFVEDHHADEMVSVTAVEGDENDYDLSMIPDSTSFDDATIESDGGDSQASSHEAIRIHATKMLFWANQAIENVTNARNTASSVSSAVTGDGSDFKPDLRRLRDTTAAAKGILVAEKAPMAGKPPRALPRHSESEIIVTGLEKVVQDANICQCQVSAFSGNAAHVNFYLPQLGMACSCGKKASDKSLNSKDPTNIDNILRPWQVEFLNSLNIRRAEDLVYQYHRRSGTLAKEMRRWRKEKNLVSVKTKSCGIALHIWNRTCKTVVKSVQSQREKGLVNFQKPDILEICLSDNQTLSTIGWIGSEAIEIGSLGEV